MSAFPLTPLITAGFLGFSVCVASAQQTVPLTPDTVAPPSESLLQTEDDGCVVDPGSGSDASQTTLNAPLSDCAGVLIPPGDDDPDMDGPVPDEDPGTTPVIPPENLPLQQNPS